MSDVDSDSPVAKQRRVIHDTLDASLDAETAFEGHILSGWVLIYETCGPDGQRGMVTRSGDALGDEDLPPWTSEGWCRYVAASGFFDAVAAVEGDDE